MKIVCIALPAHGHIDFGGLGFIQLAARLQTRGNEVIWYTSGEQVAVLRRHDQVVVDEPQVRNMALFASPSASSTFTPDAAFGLTASLRNIYKRLSCDQPAILLLDRLLVYGAPMAETLGVPYVAIGTPGGFWNNCNGVVMTADGPVNWIADTCDPILHNLGWGPGISSFWLRSPHLNLCFVGKNFYMNATIDAERAAYVRNMTDQQPAIDRDSSGISFGNVTNNLGGMVGFLGIYARHASGRHIEVITGARPELRRFIEHEFPGLSKTIRDWADFPSLMPRLRYFGFFGGVGTLWHCVNNVLPMVIVPGLIADQMINAESVHRLGLGHVLGSAPITQAAAAQVIAKLEDDWQADAIGARIIAYRGPANYTATLDTIADRIESLARGLP